jgi:hypothetical protein
LAVTKGDRQTTLEFSLALKKRKLKKGTLVAIATIGKWIKV